MNTLEPMFGKIKQCWKGSLEPLKQGEVYHQEYENHYQAQDGISESIDYYNHRRPHQGIGFAAPYQKLTGQEKRIIKERKTRALAAQKIRKIENRRKINLSILSQEINGIFYP